MADGWVFLLKDDFSTNTIGNYTFSVGAGTLTVSGGQLVPSSSANKTFRSTALPTLADTRGTSKIVTGSVSNTSIRIWLRYLDANNYLQVIYDASGLRLYKRDAGTLTQLGTTAAYAPVASTAYWLRFSAVGNVLLAELFTADPAGGASTVQTCTTTLAGGDATKFGTGIAGQVWWMMQSVVDTTARFDDLRVEAPAFFGAAQLGGGGSQTGTPNKRVVAGASLTGRGAIKDIPALRVQARAALSGLAAMVAPPVKGSGSSVTLGGAAAHLAVPRIAVRAAGHLAGNGSLNAKGRAVAIPTIRRPTGLQVQAPPATSLQVEVPPAAHVQVESPEGMVIVDG